MKNKSGKSKKIESSKDFIIRVRNSLRTISDLPENNKPKEIVKLLSELKIYYTRGEITPRRFAELGCNCIFFDTSKNPDIEEVVELSCDLELPNAHIGGNREVMTKELVEKIEALEKKYLK